MTNSQILSAILWVAAGGILILLIMRRRKRKMQGWSSARAADRVWA